MRRNEADSASFGPIKIDKTKPTLTSAATSPPGGSAYNAGTWTRFSVEVTFDCQDALSGVAADTVPDETVSTEGENQSVTSMGACTDAAGNEADPETFSNIDIDKTKPTRRVGGPPPRNGERQNGRGRQGGVRSNRRSFRRGPTRSPRQTVVG